MGEYEKLHFFGHFFITKAHKNLSSRGKKKNLKNSNGPEKSAHVLGFCTFFWQRALGTENKGLK
jgi:hypothetical protein